MFNKSRLWSYFAVGVLSTLYLGCEAKKAISAENIVLNYGAFEIDVTVDSLETYANTGELEGALDNYAGFLAPEQLEQLKVGLITSADFSHLAIAQFLYSFQGEQILKRASRVIKTKARQPGFYAIRSALILAAADKENGGLTPLNVLKKFPTKTLRIDSKAGLAIFKDLSRLVQENSKAIAAVENTASLERQNKLALAPKVRNLDLLIPGKSRYKKEALMLDDETRKRSFPVNLYLPKIKNTKPLSLIVISHGLGTKFQLYCLIFVW